MRTIDQLNYCIEIAAEAHAGQVDKRDEPYILHVVRVMLGAWKFGETAACAGVLHDVMEDCGYTREDLLDLGVIPEVVDVVEVLSRHKGETYRVFIERVGRVPLATKVKLCDLADNMNPERAPGEPGGKVRANWESMVQGRYAEAVQYLQERLTLAEVPGENR